MKTFNRLNKEHQKVEKQRNADLTQVHLLKEISAKIDVIIRALYGGNEKPESKVIEEPPTPEIPVKLSIWQRIINNFKFTVL